MNSAGDPDRVDRALRDRFGLEALRGSQREAIEAVLEGRDVLLTMPTGAGKSLCYQLPALLLDGLTLVVSPLIALMRDQVDGLARRGLPASFVNSSIEAPERRRRIESATRGELALLFVAPERFRSAEFVDALPSMRVVRMAVDEAHCASQWGHDFRPDYARLAEYRRLAGNPPAIALTATATPRVAADIVRLIGLRDPLVIRTGIERPNLFLGSTTLDLQEAKLPAIAERVRAIDGPGIVYSALIRDLEELHSELARAGVHSLVYHGKLSREERERMQARFMASEREVVLATNAFGLGVDKPDIRFVLHAQMPRTLEAWTQEVGRAGRDGKPSWCELFFFGEDIAVQRNFVAWANPSLEYLVSVYETLRAWGERVQTKDLADLRDELLVKNRADNRVSVCLKWFEVLGVTEGSFETHDLHVVRELDLAELGELVGTEAKERADLEALWTMTRFASTREECRRVSIARHFDLPAPSVPCGACDVCTDAEAWLAQNLVARPTIARGTGAVRGAPPSAEPRFQRGDWVRIDGRHLGQVIRVEGSGRKLRLVVESASDLTRRTIDPSRADVERLER